MRSRLRAAILVLAVSAGPTSAQESSPLGLERPFLFGDIYTQAPVTIDLGGDGTTDLVVAVDGLLNGTEKIPIGDPWSLQSIVRGADGRWRHAQSFPLPSEVHSDGVFAKGDVDGDGSEDIILGTIRYRDLWGEDWRRGIDFLRQYPPGELHRVGGATLDSTIDTQSGIHILGDGSGRVLIATPTYVADEGYTIEGTMLQWRAGAGWTERWRALPDSLVDYDQNYVGAILLGDGDPMLISYADNPHYSPRWGIAVPIRTDGWGSSMSFVLPSTGRFFELERGGERQVWDWTRYEPDSLYQITRTPGTDSVHARAIAIEGMPEYPYVYPIDAVVAPSGDAYFLARDSGRWAILVCLTPEGSARFLGRCVGPREPTGLIVAPDGSIEILWKDSNLYSILPPRAWENPPPCLPMNISAIDASADFDGDQRIDLVVQGTVGGVSAVWLLRGMDRSPWFRAPEPVSPLTLGRWRYDTCFLADLDGDGHTDLIQLFDDTSGDGHPKSIVCRFWDGWRFQHDSASDVALMRLYDRLTGDFDGDGRDELLVRTYDGEQLKAEVLRWNRDRTPAPPVDVENTSIASASLWQGGDVDGDGRDEMMSARERGFSLLRIDPATGSSVTLGSWANTLGFSGGGLADLTGDGFADFYWFGTYDSWVWSSGKTGDPLATRTGIPLVPCRASFSAVDIDADGKVDLVGDGYGGSIEMITDPLGSPRHSAWVLPEHLGGLSQSSYTPIIWADVDRDGDPDLVTVYQDGIRVHLNETLQPAVPGGAQPMIRLTGRNPARGEAHVAVHCDCAGEIALDLFDVTGRRVWKDRRNASAEGWVDVSIRPKVGGAVGPSGVYFLRAEVSGRVETQRIVLGF